MSQNKYNPYLKNVNTNNENEMSPEEIQAQKIKEIANEFKKSKPSSNPFDLKSHLKDLFDDATKEEK